jgi:hypothetical protein
MHLFGWVITYRLLEMDILENNFCFSIDHDSAKAKITGHLLTVFQRWIVCLLRQLAAGIASSATEKYTSATKIAPSATELAPSSAEIAPSPAEIVLSATEICNSISYRNL